MTSQPAADVDKADLPGSYSTRKDLAAGPRTPLLYKALHNLIDCRFDELDCRVRSILLPAGPRDEMMAELAAVAERATQAKLQILSEPSRGRRMFYEGKLDEMGYGQLYNSGRYVDKETALLGVVFKKVLLKRRIFLGETGSAVGTEKISR